MSAYAPKRTLEIHLSFMFNDDYGSNNNHLEELCILNMALQKNG